MNMQSAKVTFNTRTLIIPMLVIITVAVYWQALFNGFVSYDDPGYVTENMYVNSGLTLDNIRWAFTTTEEGNWHPVTWLSHMTDCQMFGLDPRGHHLISILLHIANTLLLFILLAKTTGKTWHSAAVSALFAIHPLHVESVAWVSERKDVLSTFFFMGTLVFYVRYVDRPSLFRYLPIVLLYAVGLMAKPMLVTLPFVLLLLDHWPLNRINKHPSKAQVYPASEQPEFLADKAQLSVIRLGIEKIPLILLSAITCLVAYSAQKGIDALLPVKEYPLHLRVMNAIVSYINYLCKTIWPHDLAVLYPLPAQIPLGQVAGALALLVAITAAVIGFSRQSPFALVGWCWFLGTLVPVIGLVQVGPQAMSDRYFYIPSIGLFIMIVWGVGEWSSRWRYHHIALATGGGLILAMSAGLTWKQVGYWKDSVSLYNHTLSVTRDNFIVHINLGVYYLKTGRNYKAATEFKNAILINPGYSYAHRLLADALTASGNADEAIRQYEEALRLKLDDSETHRNFGVLLETQGKGAAAFSHFSTALQLNPNDGDSQFNYGIMLESSGRLHDAAKHYSKALRIKPEDAECRNRLNRVLRMINES
jgi:Flp pilus assembly protein TadD